MARNRDTAPTLNEVIFEFVTLGNSVKVSAIDANSGTEVVITGPRTAQQSELERVALQKLKRALGI